MIERSIASLLAQELTGSLHIVLVDDQSSDRTAELAASTDFAGRVLASHNRERARMGMPPPRWNARLSAEAGQWATALARRGAFEHSPDRDDAGENLWMGSGKAYSPEQMVGQFLSEGRAFRPGRFPNVSNTGNWAGTVFRTAPATRSVSRIRFSRLPP